MLLVSSDSNGRAYNPKRRRLHFMWYTEQHCWSLEHCKETQSHLYHQEIERLIVIKHLIPTVILQSGVERDLESMYTAHSAPSRTFHKGMFVEVNAFHWSVQEGR